MSNPLALPVDVEPLITSLPLSEEGLIHYEEQFSRHYQGWSEILMENHERLQRGSYSLHWMNTDGANWGKRAKPSSRGLTYTDTNRIPAYGTLPEHAEWRNFAPRGSVREPYRERMPVLDEYVVMERDDVWADNVLTLYEEAKARQWNATRDIPWGELEPLPEDLEKATCQLCTFLTEVEFVAGDFPAKWLYRIPQDFLEVKSFLATQIMDEARHQEVFRKRAIAGGGLLHASPGFEWALKAILEAPTHTMGTFLLNLLGEGLVLSIFRSGEMIAKTFVDKEIFRRCLQDEARHVSYGVLQLKTHLDAAPDREAALEQMHRFADVGEMVILTAFTEAALVEPVAILLAGSLGKIDQGMQGLAHVWTMFIEEYFARCDRAGFDRRARSRIPLSAPWAS
ncbi:MAG: ferritin-like domain-containing protein [Deltaproteobacteria bacterium]|nr:ferritin-like domain-containing protein [Deltaproteobacteria bacterium]